MSIRIFEKCFRMFAHIVDIETVILLQGKNSSVSMQGGEKTQSFQLRARMLMQTKVSLHVETVVLLSQRKVDDYVEVELELDELDVTSAETARQPQCPVEKEKAIRDALEHFGMV